MPRLWTRCRRIAVIGARNAGKTIFITSLINHLRAHDPERPDPKFDLGKGRVTEFREIRRGSVPVFNYGSYRRRMARDRCWPEKTTDISCYRCYFKLTRRSLVNYYLELWDFPGERYRHQDGGHAESGGRHHDRHLWGFRRDE